jgi:hypothetical protein
VSGGLIGSTIIANTTPSHFVRDDASLLDKSVLHWLYIDLGLICAAASVTPISLSLSLHRHSYSSMIKFGVAVVRGPLDVVPMTRLKVEEDSSALHVLADALQCTSVEAEEQISRLEAFTSFAGEGKTALGLDDLQDPISSFKSDGFKAIKAYLTTDTAASTEGDVRTPACSAARSLLSQSVSLSL